MSNQRSFSQYTAVLPDMMILNTDLRKKKTWSLKKAASKTCSKESFKKRIPILEWLPKYQMDYLIQDIIAGITVALTAIPQGIAYAVVAGLPPEYGLYASLTAGLVYVFFGSCYYVTVGPTAIISALTARYVSGYSHDFAILVAFLSGIMILVMGLLNLGFLVEFISMPVISGFTTAAALQIAASQLKALFGLSGSSGDYFSDSIRNFFEHIKTIKLNDTLLGLSTIIMLALLKKIGQGCKRTDGFLKQVRWFTSLSRNAVVVIIGIIIAYTLEVSLDTEPLVIVRDIGSGLPTFGPPPFSTVVGNETYNFTDMLNTLGLQAVVLPLVIILESVAIAKAFAGGTTIDATQEMIALGLCNIFGSFGQSMPVTGSFTRTALNYVSGVKTAAGGITNVIIIVIALTVMTSTFYYIPKASLAGLIIFAMFSMLDYVIFVKLWKNSKRELFVMVITIIVCLFTGLEYGIMAGIVLEAAMLLYRTARPTLELNVTKAQKADLIIVTLTDNVSYCAAEHLRKIVVKASQHALSETLIIIDGTNLKNMDFSVASNLMSVVNDLEKRSKRIILMNFKLYLKNMCIDIESKCEENFMYASNAIELSKLIAKDV